MKRILCIIAILTLLLGAVGGVFADEEVVITASNGASNEVEADSARQLRIFKEALLRGTSEQSRVDAVIELLHRGDRDAWEILLQVLVSRDNAAARRAVCRGLVKNKAWGDIDRTKKDFLEPLLSILVDFDGEDAKLAAEALSIYDYSQIGGRLRNIVRSEDLENRIRINVIEALKLWSDKESISELVGLVDDKDSEISAAAEKALQEVFGIPAGTNKEDLKSIVRDLQRKKPIEIIRDLMAVQRERMAAQREQMRQLEAEREKWEKLYLGALDKEYEALTEDVARGKMLVEKLSSELTAVKIWALGKVSAYTGGTPEGLREKLIALVSDGNSKVRLETARVLSKMSVLDPASGLLSQLKVEQDEEVSLMIFEALGEACFFALSSGSGINLLPQIREETLAIAAKYISESDALKAGRAAEVIRKLLEPGGLDPENCENYLRLVGERYKRAKSEGNGLSADILGSMARLCASTSGCRDIAAVQFGNYFVEGLDAADKTAVREAAVRGLINVDRAEALKVLTSRGFVNDPSANIRKSMMNLAGQIGSVTDVEWLAGRLNVNGDNGSAWQAIVTILTRQGGDVAAEWAEKLAQSESGSDRVRELLELTEKKAEAEKNDALLLDARMKLVELYGQRNDYIKVIEYCGKILAGPVEGGIKAKVELTLLTAYLRNSDFVKVSELVLSKLTENKDLSANDSVVVRIDVYLSSEQVGAEAKKTLLDALAAGKPQVLNSPNWTAQLTQWREKYVPQTEKVQQAETTEGESSPAEMTQEDTTEG